MTRTSTVAVLAIGAFLAMPATRVYTSHSPWITRMEIMHNDLKAISGRGVPGTFMSVAYSQRSFAEGKYGDGNDPFQICSCVNNCNQIIIAPVVVDSWGNWGVGNLDIQVFPSVPNGACAGGVMTQIHLNGSFLGEDGIQYLPVVDWLDVDRVANGTTVITEAQIHGANFVSAMVADGPNDDSDKDEDGANLCTNGLGCGATVSWKKLGGTFLSPSVSITSGGLIDSSPEYQFLAGAVQGHAPGGSIVAAAEIQRDDGNTSDLSGILSALKDACSGSFFDLIF